MGEQGGGGPDVGDGLPNGGCADLESRAAYLGGLVKGLDLASGSELGRVLQLVVDLLGDLARETARLGARSGGSDGAAGPRSKEDADAASGGDATPGGACGPAADVPVFFACECPRCGEDIFIEADTFRAPASAGSRSVRVLEAPSLLERGLTAATAAGSRETTERGAPAGKRPAPQPEPSGSGALAFLPREFEVTCSNCGEVFLVREKAPVTGRPGRGRLGPEPVLPRRPGRHFSRPLQRPTQH